MDWDRADPVTEIDGRLAVLREDRDTWQARRAEAAQHVREDDEEIDQLLEERLRFVPAQR